MRGAGGPSHWRTISPGLTCIACMACGTDVSVQLLPGDQALTRGDASPGAVGPDGATADRADAHGLYFSGPYDHVEIADSPLLDVPQDFAIEAWVLVKTHAAGHGVFNRWTASVGDIELTFGVPDPISLLEYPRAEPVPSHSLATWGYVRKDLWITTVAPSLPSVGVWHHLASSYGAGSLRLYVDGARVGSMDSTERIANAPNAVFIGATSRSEHAFDATLGSSWWPPIDGNIAEVRISSINRYAIDFVPERRLLSDASTIALWHLDEGKGATAIDSGPNHLNGTITGPQWVSVLAR